ncbi:phospholipase D-like domain-containing protein [Rosistilla oblonga]|uniref:phospholipase D family protein n=1 Tax=Rosistilla oblonga TaxID=2527990 RepID=UPI003A9867F1
MAKFLDTTGVNFYLQNLIKEASVQLVLVSPYLQLNDRIRELLEDKNRMKIDVRIVYGKVELRPDEITWLRGLDLVRTSFCKNLHAKCYMSEHGCIVTSMNLYEFSQVNNNEMGIYFDATDDRQLYSDAKDEVQRILRVSETVRMSAERVEDLPAVAIEPPPVPKASSSEKEFDKLTTSKLAKQMGVRTKELSNQLIAAGLVENREGKTYLTAKGKAAGGEFRTSQRFGPYFIWPTDLKL